MTAIYKAQIRFLFHAHIKMKISAFYDDSLFDELYAVLEDIDKKYNSYQPDSYIDQINKHAGDFVEVDDTTIEILKGVITLSSFFDGTYDITIMPLLRLWGFYKDDNHKLPSSKEINYILPLVNYKHIEIEGNQVKIGKGQEIVTGSFIKAYAVDKLTERMKEIGIDDAIINAGGSTIRAINGMEQPSWQVNVRNPENEKLMFALNIRNQAYSTSSQSKTSITIDGVQYGHILNPKTGYPSKNKQIGIITDTCMAGDIISTGLYNETPDGFLKKMSLLSQHYKLEGFLLNENNQVTYTKGFLDSYEP